MFKLAGHLPLQDMIANILTGAQTKIASEEKKDDDKEKDKAKKLVAYEKKEHGGKIPTIKEEEAEKKASAIDLDDEGVEKLASSLELLGDALEKQADSIELGTESAQGGTVLATQSPTSGKQSYKKDGSKKHQPPMNPSTKSTKDNPGPSNAMQTDDNRAPGGNGAKYPAKGVLKTAGQGVLDRIRAAASGKTEAPAQEETSKEASDKASQDMQFLLGKMAESTQGGTVLTDDKVKAPVPSNPGREHIKSNDAVVATKKVQAKAPQKKLLSEVLTEPALTKSTDTKVHENLRNASKGGVKIAAARVLLQKIAEEGCTCKGAGECKHCKLKKAMSKKTES